MAERLQKLLARAGLASRRRAEDLIRAGAVRVNGQVARLGEKADPERDRIEVEGRLLRFPRQHVHLLLNKPRGTVCTAADPEGRPTVFALVKKINRRVFAVGRLPWDTEGLLVLTTDGTLADTLLRGRLRQTYWVKTKGRLTESEAEVVEKAAGRRQAEPLGLRCVKPGANPWYEVTLVEPRGDWLRRTLFRLGHPVEKTKRMALGSLRDPALGPGRFRELTPAEVARLREEASGEMAAATLRQPAAAGQRRAG